ncbi:replication protein A 70 kDa DNA-binding subunit C-like, partial [Trifolium medium]|nr:replication protein A 70 kDa DNA-binding subunit C-like [Trifolium medium]
MDSKDQKVKLARSSMEIEKNKLTNSVMDTEKVQLPSSSMATDKLKELLNSSMDTDKVKGNTIQATVIEKDIEHWKPKLAEGKTYYMRNFKVYDNDTGFKMSPHKFRLTFVGATRVDEVEIPGMPKTSFNFKDFSEIQAGQFVPDLLVDAIGVIDSIKKCVTATNTKKGNVAFTLKDLRDNVLDCTLWDALSGEFLRLYNQQTESGPVVLIIKHARVKEPQ